jgi:hypothetical protein
MEPEAPLPCSQENDAAPSPEPDESKLYHPILPLQDTFEYYRPAYISVFSVISCTETSHVFLLRITELYFQNMVFLEASKHDSLMSRLYVVDVWSLK